ncbi:alpha/beta hydrolase [Advenella kashmirensis W13003]|uniref:Alpha/beta hydrolase n=1 Tax=Advenella kashmirensis W13003 TaxID=1424334 RepID=V8QP45_9BURK|nr:alpha/beta fold hydrolase [Advenella kashmirensis]ETF00769.1 alpha/beta hydrolase [Advenella kashmirensis W13003]
MNKPNAVSDNLPPVVATLPRCFYSGTRTHPVYVDYIEPTNAIGGRMPIVMLHGAFHTGSGYIATPDGRPGWAFYFAQRGHAVFVVDWPGHGRSPASASFHTLSATDIADAIAVLLESIGPAIVMAHSAGGPIAWALCEQCPESVVAVVGLAPGPPANIQKPLPDDRAAIEALRNDESAGCPVYSPEDAPVYVDEPFIKNFWANAARFPQCGMDAYCKSIVAESARILNERFNIGGRGLAVNDPARVADRPILIVTGDSDPRHPRHVDGKLADYLNADHLWLADAGMPGNGHMFMLEDNSDDIAALIAGWLDTKKL